jgi:hypothetical protein
MWPSVPSTKAKYDAFGCNDYRRGVRRLFTDTKRRVTRYHFNRTLVVACVHTRQDGAVSPSLAIEIRKIVMLIHSVGASFAFLEDGSENWGELIIVLEQLSQVLH